MMNDTAPEIAAKIRERLMRLSGAERFVIGARMFESARAMVLASLPAGVSHDERKRLLFERFYRAPLPPCPSLAAAVSAQYSAKASSE